MTPETCIRTGCTAKHHARGLCGTHYARALRNGDLPPRTRVPMDPLLRVLSWLKEDGNGCWVATASVNGYGYARISSGSAPSVAVHRLMYEHHIGPIPGALVLDHLCRNRACCNPWHLDPVTERVNILRGEGPSAVNVTKTHCAWGHPFDGHNLRMDGNKRVCRTCHAWHARKSRARRQAGGAG